MSFWQNWSDGKKWVMGIASALIIASVITVVTQRGLKNNPLPEIPGDTGWIFAGYYDADRNAFTEGPYVSIITSTTRGQRQYVEIGDVVRLTASRPVIIVDFKSQGIAKKLLSPITKGVIEANDQTDIRLPAGTELVVRDVSEGHWPDNPQTALWLRVVRRPV